MNATELAVARLSTEEGFSARAYRDTVGRLTIGYGFNIDAGISQSAAVALLTSQVTDVWAQLSVCWWWASLDDVRASAVIDVAFNVGVAGLLHFPRMLSAIGAKDWVTAKMELLDSDAARQLPSRYNVLAQILLTGDP